MYAFVTAALRGDGYDIPHQMLVIISVDLTLLTAREMILLKGLEDDVMREKYDEIVWKNLRDCMEVITPRLRVKPADLSMDAKPVSFGLQLDPVGHDPAPAGKYEDSADLPTPVPGARFDRKTPVNENFDLSRTSVPITEDNYKGFMYSNPHTPIVPLDMLADPEPPNYLPASMWPRAPPLGMPHFDAFTGLQMRTIHRPVFDPSIGRYRNGWGEDESEVPLLGEYRIDRDYGEQPIVSNRGGGSKHTDKVWSMVSTVEDKLTEEAEIPPWSRWSAERLSFEPFGSGIDRDPDSSPASPSAADSGFLLSRIHSVLPKHHSSKTAASDVTHTRSRSSKSRQLADPLRRPSPGKGPGTSSDEESLHSDHIAKVDTSKRDGTGDSSNEWEPTTANLLHLRKKGHSLAEVKAMCKFEESVEELERMWWRAVINQ